MKLDKDQVLLKSGVAMLFSGTVMAFVSLLLPPMGEIDDSALWYTGQCFIYSGSAFGLGVYLNNGLKEIQGNVANMVKKAMEDEKKKDKEEE